VGNHGGGDDPAGIAWLQQGAIAPVDAGPGVVDADELRTLRPPVPEPLVEITRPDPKKAAGDDLHTRC
jgi:hypothetical protein